MTKELTRFELLFDKKAQTTLKRAAHSFYKEEADAEDLYQNATLRIYNQIHKYTEDTNFLGWAYSIMRNQYINEFRAKKRQRFIEYTDYNHNIAGHHTDDFENKEILGLLKESNIPNIEMVLDYANGYSYNELTEKYDVPLANLKTSIFVCRKKIKKNICFS